jgi:hypothetical protein
VVDEDCVVCTSGVVEAEGVDVDGVADEVVVPGRTVVVTSCVDDDVGAFVDNVVCVVDVSLVEPLVERTALVDCGRLVAAGVVETE